VKLIPNLDPIDKRAIYELGIPGMLLMEEAGRNVAARVLHLAEERRMGRPQVTVVCGKGNNGGDGFVCARKLAMTGAIQVTVIHAGLAEDMEGDALANFVLLKRYPVSLIHGVMDDQVAEALATSDIVVDALFGSGLSRHVEGHHRDLINAMNDCGAYTVAVDLPSGVHSATGEVLGIAVQADFTVTFAAPKPGLYLYPGKGYAGRVDVVDIGIPPMLIEADPSRIFLMTPKMIRNRMPQRTGLSHKYSYGAVLVIAGSQDMPGAAAMTAQAALKAGAGIVGLACPASAFDRMQLPPEIICHSLPETADGTITPEAFDALAGMWGRTTTVAFGPGLTNHPSAIQFTERLVNHMIHHFEGQVVIDADGLNCLSALPHLPKLSPRFVLTPHLGECARLIGVDTHAVQNDLLTACEKTAHKYNATTVLKSASTVIYGSNNRMWINPTGNPGMATAGSGDVLTGIVAGFLAQGLVPDRAARVAVYLHGLAGDKAAEALTEYCLTATDLIRYLPQAMQTI